MIRVSCTTQNDFIITDPHCVLDDKNQSRFSGTQQFIYSVFSVIRKNLFDVLKKIAILMDKVDCV
jgi:hypothetical protein